ncbi:multiheme c-type cytochrome [Roseiconus lacunae]|uniref:multiheme c-type cytochrome n=1 Tax=Roseiconus lacunae TaxID=2605694 RepID=UPI00308518D7|nr:multiheme c-type cytochrome [Stieleria sp. HD01]
MPKSPAVLLVFAILMLVGGYLWYSLTKPNDDVDLNALVKRQSQRESLREIEGLIGGLSINQIDELARQGRGQSLPNTLISRPMPDTNTWFVGRERHDVGVEIPFKPGHVPTSPPDLDPIHQNPGFLGAQACRECHESIYQSFIQTAHHRTSRKATPDNIAGSFETPDNELFTRDPEVWFEMIRRDQKSFQRVRFFDWMFEVPIDITVGSNLLGESYLYWHGDKLYQLHASYLTESDVWANSPGYVDGDAVFSREIHTACLECHATYIDARQDDEHFTPGSLILGVSCERCHGPGKDHVDFHKANPTSDQAYQITVPSNLTRDQQMQVCGQCHTGVKPLLDPLGFKFRPGDRLEDHYELTASSSGANGVHTSNQMERLSQSRCFTETSMACVDCHNPHQNDRGRLDVFSKRCLECHEVSHCGAADRVGEGIEGNCIDCHMPRRATENMSIETASGDVFPPLRDHYIRVDDEATSEFLKTR